MKKKNVKWQNDYQLVQKFLLGDAYSGYLLYDQIDLFVQYYLYKKLVSYGLESEEIEDLKSEIILKTVEDLKKYQGKSKFSTWVLGYARIFALKKIKGILQERKMFQKMILSYVNISQDPLTILLRKEEQEQIVSSFSTLSHIEEKILYLRIYQLMKFQDIADLLSISYQQAFKKYHSGKKILQNSLEEYFQEFVEIGK